MTLFSGSSGYFLFFFAFLFFSISSNAQCVDGDCENGQGTFIYESGTRYEGFFKDGSPFGFGVSYYANGNRFEGQWDRFPKGQGTLYYSDGTVRNGIWEKLTLVKDFACKSGDCQNGEGEYEYHNGDQYKGQFKDELRHGRGRLRFANGSIYEGQFKQNQYDGYGTLIDEAGLVESGLWEANDLIRPAGIRGDVDQDSAVAGVSFKPSRVQIGEGPILLNPTDIKVWAVVVGISNYSKMPKLNYTDDDAYQVYAFLKSPEGGALPDKQVTVLIDESATKERIEMAMRKTFNQADENDVILLYFSGHGVKGAFLPIDYKGRNKVIIEHSEIQQILNESPAKYKICIADACHSGSLAGTRSMASGEVSEAIRMFYKAFEIAQGGTALLLSSKSEELSLEANGLRQGIFSHFLIRGMKGEADENSDRVVTIQELYEFVSKEVSNYTVNYQTPVITGDYDKNMPVGVVRTGSN